MVSHMVELKGVTKIYNGKVRALDNMDLTIDKGEWLAIIGPSGSGKSTVLNIIGALDKATEGTVRVAGLDLTRLKQDTAAKFRREKVGFVFQQFHLVPYLTAVENVMLAQYFHSLVDEREAKQALEKVSLGHRLDHLPSQLSAGEQQRVCIARALINEPELLLADEPTGNLDQDSGKMVLDIIEKLHKEHGLTMALVTHDLKIADKAQRIITLIDGRVTSCRKTEQADDKLPHIS